MHPNTPPALPVDPDDLPPMRYQEASWHTHVASVNATPTAADQIAPAVALAAAAAGGKTVCGVYFEPMSAGALLAIQAASRLALDAGVRVDGPDEVAILVFCLARSDRAFDLAEAGQLNPLLKEARRLFKVVPLEKVEELTTYCSDTIAVATGQKKTESPATHPVPVS